MRASHPAPRRWHYGAVTDMQYCFGRSPDHYADTIK